MKQIDKIEYECSSYEINYEWILLKTEGKLPKGRKDHTMNYLYTMNVIAIYGGIDEKTRYLDTLSIINLKNLQWLDVTIKGYNKPGRAKHCSCEYKSKLIIFGGLNE